MSPSFTYLRLGLVAAFWGGTFVAGRMLAPLATPEVSAFARFTLAGLVLLAWAFLHFGHLPGVSRRQGLGILLLGATGILAYNLLFFAGLQSVEAGRAALIIALNPVLIGLASVWLFGEETSIQRLVGAGLSVTGAILVIGRGDLGALLAQGVGTGETLLLGCVLAWTAYTLIGKRLLRGMHPLLAVTYASVAGAGMLGIVVLLGGGQGFGGFAQPLFWLNIAYLALFGTVLGFVWYYEGVAALGAARAGQFINLVPVSGVALGAMLLGETITWSLLLGGALVVTGLWLTNRRARAARPPG